MRVAGAVIAGGRSRRMGEDKGLATVGSATILQRIVAKLEAQTEIVVLNSNLASPPQLVAGFPVIHDIIHGVGGPLAGLHAALAWGADHGYQWITTVPVDTPFLPSDLSSRLLAAASGTGAAVALSAGQAHYIIGTWSTDLAAELELALVRDRTVRVRDWAGRAEAIAVEWPVIDYDPFFNVNTPQDLALARQIAERFGV